MLDRLLDRVGYANVLIYGVRRWSAAIIGAVEQTWRRTVTASSDRPPPEGLSG